MRIHDLQGLRVGHHRFQTIKIHRQKQPQALGQSLAGQAALVNLTDQQRVLGLVTFLCGLRCQMIYNHWNKKMFELTFHRK